MRRDSVLKEEQVKQAMKVLSELSRDAGQAKEFRIMYAANRAHQQLYKASQPPRADVEDKGAREQGRKEVSVKTYNQVCYDLAAHFLESEPCSDDKPLFERHCHTLALAIQRAIEDWFDTPENEPVVPAGGPQRD